jgi:formamidopyrimidine-DNA glycosylase
MPKTIGSRFSPRLLKEYAPAVPELAEVEYYRKQWDPGLRQRIVRAAIHGGKRVTRGLHAKAVEKALTGASYLDSEARAKQMLFRFSGGGWLGVHLGMTGHLTVQPPDFVPGRHDHLVLYQKKRALVFTDARMFGRLRWEQGDEPEWWTALPPAVTSPEFTLAVVREFFQRRARLAIKAALLVQTRFPGVGNWMADEILWQSRVSPLLLCGALTPAQTKRLWEKARLVCAGAMTSVAIDFSDPPAGWFFHARWSPKGRCPRCKGPLNTAQVGGRTTRWCPKCQR